jgi:hypothetical protein
MPAEEVKHAFISYVKEDSAEVDRLCRILERSKIPYWRDRKDLAPGDQWKAKIRDAIRSDSLIFLACFSDNSRGRDKSFMNEELFLAVEEFRLRPPGATWLIPVRFDDGDVPAWDLGAGRMLSDLNFSDLFGDDYAAEAGALVTTVRDVMGVSISSPAQTIASVESAETSERRVLLRRATKDMVHDSSRRIALDDLIKQETRKIVAVLNDEDAMSGSGMIGDTDEQTIFVAERALEMANLVEPLCWSMQVAGRWADTDTLGIWTSALKTLAIEGTRPRSGYTSLVALRSLPALLLLTTGVVASHAENRWSNLRAIATPTIPTGRGTVEPLMNLISPYAPFDSSLAIPNILARAAEDEMNIADTVRGTSGPRAVNYHTPVSEWMLRWLRPIFEDQFAVVAEFDAAYNAAETFLGVLSQDAANQTKDTWRKRSSWYGRATWIDRYREGDVVDDLGIEFDAAGANWPPLTGGLFEGSPERAREALAAYSTNFKSVAGQRW